MNIEEARAQRDKEAKEKEEKDRTNALTIFRQQLRDSFGDVDTLGLTVEYEDEPLARVGGHIISQFRHDDGQRDWMIDGKLIGLRWRRSGNDHASNLLRLVELVGANVVF